MDGWMDGWVDGDGMGCYGMGWTDGRMDACCGGFDFGNLGTHTHTHVMHMPAADPRGQPRRSAQGHGGRHDRRVGGAWRGPGAVPGRGGQGARHGGSAQLLTPPHLPHIARHTRQHTRSHAHVMVGRRDNAQALYLHTGARSLPASPLCTPAGTCRAYTHIYAQHGPASHLYMLPGPASPTTALGVQPFFRRRLHLQLPPPLPAPCLSLVLPPPPSPHPPPYRLAPTRSVDPLGSLTQQYPFNPSG
eukprot:365185-Chlamydomonas_euryale.AAC.3